MIELNNISSVYFIGIGGIGMSALARYFQSRGVAVSGYDKAETDLTKALTASGMDIHYEDDINRIPRSVSLVVYTPAIPSDHTELNFYKNGDYTVVKRSDVLQAISHQSFNICIGGTHGKTTITTMTGHILRHSGYGCNAFLGGISANYQTNFWSSERNVSVIEADEYDRSFLKLSPDIAIVTAMDADHLDIYGTAESLEDAFIQFAGKVKPGGLLLSRFGLKRSKELTASYHLTYSLQNDSADVYGANIRISNGSYTFDVMGKDWMIDDVVLHMGGMHNVENSISAIAVAQYLGIEAGKIKAAVAAFAGVKRRFEYIIKTEELVFIDDYAHHPEELRALIGGAKTLFHGKKCTVVFQPHLYTRTRDLADDFARSLDMADSVVLLPIYPARELPIEGVSSEMILDKMEHENKRLLSKEELCAWVKTNIAGKENQVLITAGAGDIDLLLAPIAAVLKG
jgi:UDP-N-acetylmuramate--alanine ligase